MTRRATRLFFFVVLLCAFAAAQNSNSVPTQYNEMTVAQLQALMDGHQLTSVRLTQYYISRIQAMDQAGPGVNSVIELNPDALNMAQIADSLRSKGVSTNDHPLLGIPVLLKDNIDTGDKMQTSAGSFALVGQPAVQDSTVAQNLRAGGAVILGKTNLSEWANFRSFESTSGWSGRGGQTNNPYGINRNPCGSSSGSGAAASANFTAVSLGTETDGSVVCPGNANGVVGLKPTVGLTSRAGVVPISHTQDTVGIHARTVADAAATLSVIQSRTSDGRDPATGGVPLGWQTAPLGNWQGKPRPNLPSDYRQFANPNGLQGKTIGVTRAGMQGFDPLFPTPQPVLDAFDQVVTQIQNAGATVVDLDTAGFTFQGGGGEFLVLCYDFKNDLSKYFGTRVGVPVAGGTLQTAIDFNNAHADVEMPFFNQDIFTFCNAVITGPNTGDTPQPLFGGMTYNQALAADQMSASQGIDAAIKQFGLDAVMTATDNPAWPTDQLFGDRFFFGSSSLAAPEGYPVLQVPATMVYGLPMGISFFGSAFSEPTLISLAAGFEAVTQTRAHNLPTFASMTPSNNTQGTTVVRPPRHNIPPAPNAGKKMPRHM